MFKIEYLSSYNFSFSGGVYVEISLRLSPAPTFRALQNMIAVMLHFLMHICV